MHCTIFSQKLLILIFCVINWLYRVKDYLEMEYKLFKEIFIFRIFGTDKYFLYQGVIRLISGHIQLDKDKYELNVTARDDGACCKNGALTTHTSTALVVVFITDVNDNKPLFEECSTYAPQVEEGAPSGTQVIKVRYTVMF